MGWLMPDVVHDRVYEIESRSSSPSWDASGYRAELRKVSDLKSHELKDIQSLQGRRATMYLRVAYRSLSTHVLLIRLGTEVAAVLWVVPSEAIKRRYSFVQSGTSAIISCVTSSEHRGRGLYPRGIEYVAASGLSERYVIWAHETNHAGIRGIEKAGGTLVGEFTRKRWLRGIIAKVDYRKLNE